MNHPIDDSIFRDYDIRGIYPSQLNESIAYILGRAIASYLRCAEIAIGYDARLSSPSLHKSLSKGIMDQGTNVVNLGLISTEMHYFASGSYNFDANIIISASHNPSEYNGLKIVTRGVIPLHGGFGLPEIKKLALEQKFKNPSQKGSIRRKEIMDDWINHLTRFIEAEELNELKVIIDAGNGMAGPTWERLANILPIKIVPLYFDPDGRFPHHLPNPLKKENIKDLQVKINEEKADFGFAFDGDADRVFLLDERGNFVSGTVTTAMLAEFFLQKYPHQTILYNAVCGRIVPETIKKFGGKPVRTRVGHSFIKELMKKERAIFSGEHSGHYYFRDNFYAESSAIAALILIKYITGKKQKVSEIVSQFNRYFESGEINYQVNDVDLIIRKLSEYFSEAKIDYLDGLSIWGQDWWVNIRPSKTEPLLRFNIEADTEKLLNDKKDLFEHLLTKFGGVKV